MPNIKPITDLRNYTEVLKETGVDSPVFLTRNGRGEYVILDMKDYDHMKAELELMKCLAKGEQSAREEGWLSADESGSNIGSKRMKIEYTPESLRDLQKIREIIIDRFIDEKIAVKVQKDITQSIRKLEIFPNMGEDLSETVKAGEGYRFLFCRKNYIFYQD